MEKLKEDEKTRLKIISAMDQMRYGYLNALFLYIYNQKCYQKQKHFVNCRTSSNWSSKLKKSEQVCKEGETDPAPSQEITEQTYNGMGV